MSSTTLAEADSIASRSKSVICVFGPLRVVIPDGDVVEIAQSQQRIVLATLCLAGSRGVSVDGLVGRVWPDGAPKSSRKTLHGYVARLRRRLGSDAILTQSERYFLNPRRFDVDAEIAREWLLSEGARDNRGNCQAVVNLVRGPALVNVTSSSLHEEFGPTLHDLLVRVMCAWGGQQLEASPGLVAHELVKLARTEHYDEAVHSLLINALTAAGKRAEALETYSRVQDRLDQDLGLDPGEALKAAQQRALAAPPVPSETGASSDSSRPVGSTRAVEAALVALHESSSQIVFLTGSPAAGKTYTASVIARRIRREHPECEVLLLDTPGSGELRRTLLSVEPRPKVQRTDLRVLQGFPHRVVIADGLGGPDNHWTTPIPLDTKLLITSTHKTMSVGPAVRIGIEPLHDHEVLALLDVAGTHAVAGLSESDRTALCRIIEGHQGAAYLLAARLDEAAILTTQDLSRGLSDPRRQLAMFGTRVDDLQDHYAKHYRRLSADARTTLRLLGWLESETISHRVSASSLQQDLDQTREVLEELIRAGFMVTATGAGRPRVRIPHLVKLYARRLSELVDSPESRQNVVRRGVLAWTHAFPGQPPAISALKNMTSRVRHYDIHGKGGGVPPCDGHSGL
jgi:DNA-binding SARP family transcriptional activator